MHHQEKQNRFINTGHFSSVFENLLLSRLFIKIWYFLFLLPEILFLLSRQCTEKFSKNGEQGRRGKMNLDHPRIIDVQNYR